MKLGKQYRLVDNRFWCWGNILLEHCGNDESVYVPEGIKKIGDMAFRRALATKTIYLSSSVSKVGVGAFANCPSLEFVSGDNVKEIYEYAFWGVKS